MIPTGYIALHRSIFSHPLFCNERPFTRLQAWAFLIADAAWRTEQRRIWRTTVVLERGQTAASTRMLGKTWGWHPAKVQRFLAALKRGAMIRTMAPDTIADPHADTLRRAKVTVITICNYSKFNDAAADEKFLPERNPIHKPIRGQQQALDLGDEFSSEPSNQKTKDKIRASGAVERYRGPPRHGMVSKKNRTKYIEKGSWEWDRNAEIYREAHNGAEPIPDRHGGFWFSLTGDKGGARRSA